MLHHTCAFHSSHLTLPSLSPPLLPLLSSLLPHPSLLPLHPPAVPLFLSQLIVFPSVKRQVVFDSLKYIHLPSGLSNNSPQNALPHALRISSLIITQFLHKRVNPRTFHEPSCLYLKHFKIMLFLFCHELLDFVK